MSRDALVVGINQYRGLPELSAPAADAQAIAHVLQTRGDFSVTRMPEVIDSTNQVTVGQRLPVTTAELEQSLIKLFKPAGISSLTTALFYFSGHGLQRSAGVREGYLATSDISLETGNFGISLHWLRRLIDESPVKHIVVILDCCHSGELFNFTEANPKPKEGHSRLFIAASRAYESAYESLDSEYSVLTQAVLSGLDPHRHESGKINSHSLLSWVSDRLSGEVQRPVFELSGDEIILTCAKGAIEPPKARLSTLARIRQMTYGFCPYRGLEPFTEKHAQYFFGREDLVDNLLEAISDRPFYAVVGASSSGKTSLLRAGLIYQLQQGDRADPWTIRYLTPGQRPLRTLAAAFVDEQASDIERAAQLSSAEQLLQTDAGLAQLIAATQLQQAQPIAAQFLLVIDQFEALLRPTDLAQVAQERQQFIACLLGALQDPSLPLKIVIGLRSDAIDRLVNFPTLLQRLEGNILTLTPVSYQQLKDIILKPAEQAKMHIEPQLLHTLTVDFTGAPGELALTQQTLLELWRRREYSALLNGAPRLTMEAYMALGGIKQVLVSRAAAIYEGFTVEERAAAERIFLALCEFGDGHADNKRRAYKSELVNETYPAALIDRTLEKLVTARLVVVGQEATLDYPDGTLIPGTAWETKSPTAEVRRWFVRQAPAAGSPETIEIAHQSLIHDWPLMRQWLHNRRDLLRYRRRLEESAQEWYQRGQPKHPEYLLVGGRLQEALGFSMHHDRELSALAQAFVVASRKSQLQQRLRSGALALLVPLALAAGMAVSFTRSRPADPQPSAVQEQVLDWSEAAQPTPQSSTD